VLTSQLIRGDLRESGGVIAAFITLALDGCEHSVSYHGRFTPGMGPPFSLVPTEQKAGSGPSGEGKNFWPQPGIESRFSVVTILTELFYHSNYIILNVK
jgi:hypothetical protein